MWCGEGHANNTALFVLEYADGFRGFVLMLPGFVTDFAYAARVDDGTIEACVFNLHGQGTSSHFSYLARNIEVFFMTGTSPYPGKIVAIVVACSRYPVSSLFRDITDM